MKVVHVSPTYSEDSLISGGERYVTELASWMSQFVETTLVSFSSQRISKHRGNLKIEIYPVNYLIRGSPLNPLSFRYLSSVLNADILHFHQINTVISDIGCLIASTLGKRVFCTDHGGGGDLVLNRKIPVFKGYHHAIIQSKFTLNYLPTELQKKAVLMKGGIDPERFCPDNSVQKEKKILYVGRILPHKGINYLIEAFRILNRQDYQLKIVGKVGHEQFYQDLKQMATGLPIEFVMDANDSQLLSEYRTAKVTVLPSVHTTCYGDFTPVPELMGFTLLESQACGTPVICTDAGGMFEFVNDGYTGFVVQQNSGAAIATAIDKIISLSSAEYAQYQANCRQWIQPFNWSSIAKKHLLLYKSSTNFTKLLES